MGDTALQTVAEIIKDEKRMFNHVVQKDFAWDQFMKYVSSAIISLSLVNFFVQFFSDGSVSCFPPPDIAGKEHTRSQAIFIDQFCTNDLPRTEYLPTFILAHGLILIIPHSVWSAIFSKDFDSFFSVATKINTYVTVRMENTLKRTSSE